MFSPRSLCPVLVGTWLVVGCDVGAVDTTAGEPALAGADSRTLAADTAITDVAAYQAVRVPIVKAERAVPPSKRNAQLVAGRDLLLKVRIVRTSTSAVRPVLRLDLAGPGADAVAYTETPVAFAGAATVDVEVRVDGENVKVGSRYALSVLEDDAKGPAATSQRARWPRAANSFEALEPRRSSGLSVVIVPIAYNDVDAPAVPAATMADLARVLYPVAEGGVSVTVAEAISLEVSLAADPQSPYAGLFPDGHPFWMSDEVFAELRALRAAAGTGAYYYGYIDHTTLFGMAEAIPAPVAYGTNNDGIITFVHELGHDLGLFHAPCGGAGGPDPAYPYAGATIGVEGYDPRSQRFLKATSHFDFMSYCAPEWVSDYHFAKLQRQLSSSLKLAPGSLRPDPVPCDFQSFSRRPRHAPRSR